MHFRFRVGQLVKSKQLKSRGVIIATNSKNIGHSNWHSLISDGSNYKVCPWYTLMLDKTNAKLFVPEVDLYPDLTGRPITGRHIKDVFDCFDYGMHFKANNPPKVTRVIKGDNGSITIL